MLIDLDDARDPRRPGPMAHVTVGVGWGKGGDSNCPLAVAHHDVFLL